VTSAFSTVVELTKLHSLEAGFQQGIQRELVVEKFRT